MTTTDTRAHHTPTTQAGSAPTRVLTGAATRALAALRLAFGFTFLWAFFDKLLALGFHTGAITNDAGTRTGIDYLSPDAWIHGGSPTYGFLTYGVPAHNPFHDFFTSLAGDTWVDWLFMAGLLGIGVALTLGIGMRLAAVTGALLYMLMWAASLPLENNPIIDEHVLGAISLVVLALTLAGDTWGWGKAWASTRIVRRWSFLR